MIQNNNTYYVKGIFSGIAEGKEIGKSDLKKIRSINFLPNSTIKNAEIISKYNNEDLSSNANSIITTLIRGVNIIPLNSNQSASKEIITNTIIQVESLNIFTNFKHEHYTQIDGTIYCKIDTTGAGIENTIIEQVNKEKIRPIDVSSFIDNVKPRNYSALASQGKGCLTNILRILFFILLLFLLFSLLKTCNSLTSDNDSNIIPLPIRDTIYIRDTNFIRQPMITINDWNLEDGDMIDVFINDRIVLENCNIKTTPQTFILNGLQKGDNDLRIKAKNYGKGSLTAFVEITDGQFVERLKVLIEPGDSDFTKIIYINE